VILGRHICSVCGMSVDARRCNGVAYMPQHAYADGRRWERPVCWGGDRESFLLIDGAVKFRVPGGQVVDLVERPDL
jgi:hypothetical protein